MPERPLPRIAVLGAGAVGCFVGGGWLAAGLDVGFIGRPRIGAEITEHGLTLSDYSGWSYRHAGEDVRFETTPDALAGAGLVVLTVKCTALAEAAGLIAKHARKDAQVLCLLNGVRPVSILRDALPTHPVIAGMVPFNVAALGSGRWHQGLRGTVTVQRTGLTEDLAARLAPSHAQIQLADDMTAIAWGKLLLNLNNPVNALSGLTLHEELSQRGYRRVLAASIYEGLEIVRAAGIEPAKVTVLPPAALPMILETPDWFFRAVGLRLQKIDRTARSSMADDLAAARKTEIDFLNGEITTLAKQLGKDAPVNARIVALVEDAESSATPSRYSAEALLKAVLQ